MLPAELNSRWLASGKLSVYTEKTCETKNVAPTNEASPFCFLDWKRFNGSEIVRSHSLGGCKQTRETFPPSTKYLCISFNGNWGGGICTLIFWPILLEISRFSVVLRRREICGNWYCWRLVAMIFRDGFNLVPKVPKAVVYACIFWNCTCKYYCVAFTCVCVWRKE